MLLENGPNYSHLQRSIDTLRSLGDRLNLDRGYDRPAQMTNGLELNLSLNPDRILQERIQQERSLERLLNERTVQEQQQRANMDHGLSIERLNLDRSLGLGQPQDRPYMNDRALMDRNLNSERNLIDRNLNNVGYGNERLSDRLGHSDVNRDINDIKYREYKAHLENLRSESSRSLERVQEEDRGATPTTPPTPISVGENFQEEKVIFARSGFLNIGIRSVRLIFECCMVWCSIRRRGIRVKKECGPRFVCFFA